MLTVATRAPRADGHLRIGVLGPLQVHRGRSAVELGSTHQRCLLALLSLQPGQVVSQQEIIDMLWQHDPPATASNLVHVYVSRLRRLLSPGETGGGDQARQVGHAPVLERVGVGYRLVASGHELDVAAFDELVLAAQQVPAADDPAAQSEVLSLLARALRCWRGPVLGRAEPRLVDHPAVVNVSNRRVDTAMHFADLANRAPRHDEVVALLRPLVVDEPLHEGLHARLMLALAADGQQAGALAVFDAIAARLVEDLGIDPGEELSAARLAVLRRHYVVTQDTDGGPPPEQPPAAESVPEAPRPAQLPADVTAFTGRTDHLHRLDALIADDPGAAASPTVNLCVITGMAGVGKTALAVHWAHRIRDRFPDGQLFIDLRGFAAAAAARPIDVLARFLRALGVPADQVPVEQDEAAELYRSLTADRALLIVLDNAEHAQQVRPLLPGGSRCLALVTSRDRLSGLAAREGAPRLSVDVLPHDEAVALLAHGMGTDRVATEPAATDALARACAWLPLALQIAAANVTDRAGCSIVDYVAELAAANRLAALEIEGDSETAVRAAFDMSYTHLPSEAQRLFRLLGLVPGHDVTVEAASALGGLSTEQARRSLDTLTRAHLLQPQPSGRYALHDLLRLYAADRAAREDGDSECRDARAALYDHYLDVSDQAAAVLYPTMLRLPAPDGADRATADSAAFTDGAAATAWLNAECANLIAIIRTTADQGPYEIAWRLGDALRGYFVLGADPVGWLTVARAALAAGEADGDVRAQAAAHLNIAGCLIRQSRPAQARIHAARMQVLAREADWTNGQAAAQGTLGELDQMQGRPHEAAEHYAQALALIRRTGRLGGLSINLNNLGVTYWHLGRLREAADLFQDSLDIERKLRSRTGEAVALANLGEVHHLMGNLHVALQDLTRAVVICQETVYRACEAESLRCLAAVCRDLGDQPRAVHHAEAALTTAHAIGYRTSEVDALNVLGNLHLDAEDPFGARDRHRAALRLARDAQHRYGEGQALVGLAAAHTHLGEPERALPLAHQALALAERLHFRVLHGQSAAALAAIHLGLGRHRQALDRANDALAVHRGIGYRRAEADVHLLLARLCDADGRTGDAREHRHRAQELVTAVVAVEPWMDQAPG